MKLLYILCLMVLISCTSEETKNPEQLLRVDYQSECTGQERDFFLYLPKGYSSDIAEKWPVILFLHGNGERGNGKDELDFVLMQGPLYEAWVQKRDLPFIIISPQLPMFGVDTFPENEYMLNRDKKNIPVRLENGVPPRPAEYRPPEKMEPSEKIENFDTIATNRLRGWELCETDLMNILAEVLTNFQADQKRVYLTGLSRGGSGTWYLASKHPQAFAAICPVVGWGHPDLIESIAKANLPVWCFAGGRDRAMELKFFYAGMNKLEELGNTRSRFTIHEDMDHSVWTRVYSGEDIYNWFLQYSLH